jgi:(2Fe-2S) ferredoxin
MAKPQHHLFVCQNLRDPGHPRGCCRERGSEDVLKAFKEEIRARGVRHQIEFDGSTCMDTCAWGPVVTVYPENVWYGKVTPADVGAILDAIEQGTVVERLLVPDEAVRKS